MKIAMIIPFAPMIGDVRKRQMMCAHSWSLQEDVDVFVPDCDEKGVKDLSDTFNFRMFGNVEMEKLDSGHMRMFLDSIFESIKESLTDEHAFVGITTGDAPILSCHLLLTLLACAEVSKGNFQAFVHRHNLPRNVLGSAPTWGSIDICEKEYYMWGVNIPGADMFVWSKGYFEELVDNMPPVDLLTWGVERYLWKRSFKDCGNFDLTNNVPLVHIAHSMERSLPFDKKGFNETEDPVFHYNRNITPDTLDEIWDGVRVKFKFLRNGMVLMRIVKGQEKRA